MSNSTEQRKLAAMMFADMLDCSALTERNQALTLALLREQRRANEARKGRRVYSPGQRSGFGATKHSRVQKGRMKMPGEV